MKRRLDFIVTRYKTAEVVFVMPPSLSRLTLSMSSVGREISDGEWARIDRLEGAMETIQAHPVFERRFPIIPEPKPAPLWRHIWRRLTGAA